MKRSTPVQGLGLLRILSLSALLLSGTRLQPLPVLAVQSAQAQSTAGTSLPTQLAVSFSAGINGPCSVGTGTLNSDGTTTANVSITGVGQCQITANQGGNSQYNPADSVTQSFTIHPVVPTLSVGAIADTPYHDAVTLTASVSPTSVLAQAPSGSVTFAIDGQPVSPAAPVSSATGVATASPIVTAAPGPHTVTAYFTSSSPYFANAQSTGNGTTFQVTREDTTLAITGVTQLAQSTLPTVSAVLKEDGTTPIPGKTVQITLGTGQGPDTCTGITNGSGVASCQVSTINLAPGIKPLSATFPVPGQTDVEYQGATATPILATIYGYLPQTTGAYTLGDLTAQHDAGNSTIASFWSVRWASLNQLSGGAAPNTFFGLAKTLSSYPPACGTTWTSTIGQSLVPPKSLPTYLGVIVTSHVTRSGTRMIGNVVGIAVMRPGHTLGTGTVLAVSCPTPQDDALVVGQSLAARVLNHRPAMSISHPSRARAHVMPHRAGGVRSWHGLRVIRAQLSKQDQNIRFGSLADHVFGDMSFSITAESVTSSLIPPDPSTVAPPNDLTVATNLFNSTAFLYSGPNRIQTGVAPGTISPTRVGVLRGTVNDGSGNPLSGVAVAVLGHPEYGQTLSRESGGYDLAVNGGGALTLTYTLDGYLAAQRQVTPSWDDYTQVDPVDLVPYDTNANPVTLSGSTSSVQVARGSTQTDSAGSRQETVLVPPGETATMVMPDGSSHPLTSAHLRLTEYTVGGNGDNRMPATLPGASAYTYCFAASLDEEAQAGAANVTFSQPMIAYNQNFLNWPVGALVPIGEYNGSTGQWKADPDGLVIKILDFNGPNGEADLAVDSSGQAATSDEYTGLGITDAERAYLASAYAVGTSLWRFTFTHDDVNFDANAGKAPIQLTAEQRAQIAQLHQDHPDWSASDIQQALGYGTLDLQRQNFDESRVVSGTPYSLHYTSNRQVGDAASRTLTIPIPNNNGSISIPNLVEIDVEVDVAGRTLTRTFDAPALPNSTTITWDGKDAYGRWVQGEVPATVRITYLTDLPFEEVRVLAAGRANDALVATANLHQRASNSQNQSIHSHNFPLAVAGGFGQAVPGGLLAFGHIGGHLGQAAEQISYTTPIGALDARADGLGGWQLSAHHTYDPTSHTLYMGDGTTISAQNLTQTIGRIAGNGTMGDTGDGGPALQAEIDAGTGSAERPADMAAGPDGSVYFVDFSGGTIRKIAPDGIITTVAGGGPGAGTSNPDPTCATDVLGDGCQATDAVLYTVYGMTVGPDGSIYFTEGDFGAVRKITPDGIVHLIGGTVKANCLISCGSLGYTGDGVPAIGASLNSPHGIAVGPDGTVYIADTFNNRIRSIGTDGLIRTLIDVGNDGLYQIATGPDGSVYYVQTYDNIYRIDPSGTVSNVTGGSTNVSVIGNAGVNGMAVDRYGDLFFDSTRIGSVCDNKVYEITTDGVEHTVAGSQETVQNYCPPGGDGGAATQATIVGGAMAVAPDGSIYQSDGPTIRKVSAPLPGLGHQNYLVASPDGSQLFSFDQNGRQQQTFDALTGQALLTFGYTSNGELSSITDANGNVTTIQHGATGNPTSITAPFGQVTQLTTDVNGYLASISDPLHERTALTMDSGGLLDSITGPKGNTFTASYDSLGLLTATTDPAGGGWTLVSGTDFHLSGAPTRVVTATSAIGRTSTLSLGVDTSGTEQVETSLPDGTLHGRTLDTSLNNAVTDTTGDSTRTTFSADPQLGLAAPIAGSQTNRTPSGLTVTTGSSKQVTLSDPTNPLTVTQQTTTNTINGNVFTSTYTANGTAGTGGTVTDTSPLGRAVTTIVDGQDRPTSTQTGNLAAKTSSYDSQGRLASETWGTGSAARTTTYSYGSDGRLASVTDPTGRVTSFTYDAAGHMLTETLPGSRTEHFTYDADGNLTSLTTPGGRTWSSAHDGLDQLSTLTPANAGNGNPAINNTYNADRQLTAVTRSDNQNIGYSYSASTGKLTNTTIPQGSYSYSYSNSTGLLTAMTAPGGMNTSYSYDGSLPTGTTWGGPVSGSVSRGYDSFYRPASDGVTGGATTGYSYDKDGLLTSAGDLSITNDSMNGLVTGTTLGNVSTSVGHNDFGELATESATANTSTVYGETYTRDQLGRITTKQETIGGATHTFTYTYDPQTGRLTQVRRDGAAAESYTYDADGNRLTGPGVSMPASYDAQGELTAYGSTTYRYDVAGNRASTSDGSGTTSYNYDPLGNLRTVTLPNSTVITYLVDGLEQRIGKEVNGTLVAGYLYGQDGQIVALLDGNNSLRSQFVYAGGAATPSYLITGGVEYRILSDRTGSPRLVVNSSSGQVMEELDYDGFGNAAVSHVASGWDSTLLPFGFGGGLIDSDTGLIHMGARDYDPLTGTWTSRDPLGFGAGDTSLYSYAHGDPINLVDPTGAGPYADGQQSLLTQAEVIAGNHNVAFTVGAGIGLSVLGGIGAAATGIPAAIGSAYQLGGWQLAAGVVGTSVVYPAYASMTGAPALGAPPGAPYQTAEQIATENGLPPPGPLGANYDQKMFDSFPPTSRLPGYNDGPIPVPSQAPPVTPWQGNSWGFTSSAL